MAKHNMLLGQARGKVGDLVFSRAFGKQIVRAKAASVANPKTIGQNTQRAILATIAKSAAAMNSLVDHSFAGVTYGAESVRHFRKINMAFLRDLYLNSQETVNLSAKGGSFVPNPLKISEGSLPAFYASVDTEDYIMAFYQSERVLPRNEDISVSTFLRAYPFLQGGDQLTLVRIRKNSGTLQDGDALFTMSLDRMVFTPNAFNDPEATIIEQGTATISSDFLDLTKTTNQNMLVVCDGGAGLGLGFSDENCYNAALILSRKVNGQWQRSAQYLELMDYDDRANNEDAIASYGNTTSASEAAEYLNQAEESVPASGVNGAYLNVSTSKDGAAPEFTLVDANSSDSVTIQGAANTQVAISAHAFAPAGKRIVTVEIDRPDNSNAAHGASSVNYNVAISSSTVGTWKVVALFDDGSRAVCNLVLSLNA